MLLATSMMEGDMECHMLPLVEAYYTAMVAQPRVASKLKGDGGAYAYTVDELVFDVRVGMWTVLCTRPEPFNFTPMGVNPPSSGSPRVRCTPTGVHRACGGPNKIKKNPHLKNGTARCHVQGREGSVQRRDHLLCAGEEEKQSIAHNTG